MRAALMVLLLALAGCVGGDHGTKDDDPTDEPPTDDGEDPLDPGDPPVQDPSSLALLLDFYLNDCVGITVMQDQSMEDIQTLLPEGFTAAPNPVTSGPNGVLAVDLFSCASLST